MYGVEHQVLVVGVAVCNDTVVDTRVRGTQGKLCWLMITTLLRIYTPCSIFLAVKNLLKLWGGADVLIIFKEILYPPTQTHGIQIRIEYI